MPLQAMLNSKNRNNLTTAATASVGNSGGKKQSNCNPSATAFVKKNAEQRQIVEQKQEEVKQSFASFLADNNKTDESVITEKTLVSTGAPSDESGANQSVNNSETSAVNLPSPVPPKQRQMKIAARFSQAN